MRVTLLHNPAAGTTGERECERLVAMIGEAGHEVRHVSCVDEQWRAALEWQTDVVAVAGGDGTLGRVAKAMTNRASVPLTLLPAGTANNIAHALGLAGKPYEALVRGWSAGRLIELDLANASGPWGHRYLIEGMGAGLLAAAIPEVDADASVDGIPRSDAKVTYILQLLKERLARPEALPVTATLDGEDVSGEYILFEAMLMPFIGPNLYLGPDRRPGDGQFDLVLAGVDQADRLRRYLESWQAGKPRLAVLPSRSGRALRIDWRGFPMHLDDEVWPAQRGARAAVELRMADRSVAFLLPGPGP